MQSLVQVHACRRDRVPANHTIMRISGKRDSKGGGDGGGVDVPASRTCSSVHAVSAQAQQTSREPCGSIFGYRPTAPPRCTRDQARQGQP
jgi:hypothetical protein